MLLEEEAELAHQPAKEQIHPRSEEGKAEEKMEIEGMGLDRDLL